MTCEIKFCVLAYVHTCALSWPHVYDVREAPRSLPTARFVEFRDIFHPSAYHLSSLPLLILCVRVCARMYADMRDGGTDMYLSAHSVCLCLCLRKLSAACLPFPWSTCARAALIIILPVPGTPAHARKQTCICSPRMVAVLVSICASSSTSCMRESMRVWNATQKRDLDK